MTFTSWVAAPKLVYFMRPKGMVGPVKIGCSAFTAERLVQVSVWSPFPLEIIASAPGPHTLERFLHRKYAELRTHSEWFHPTPDMLRRIALVADGVSIEDAFDAEPDPKDKMASTPRYRDRAPEPQTGTKATPSQNIGKGLAPFVKNVSAPAGKPEHLKAAAPASQPDRIAQ